MKKVLIPLGLSGPTSSIGCQSFIRRSYLDKVIEQGLFPLLVSPLSPQSLLDAALDAAQGIMLLGGEDVDPKYYDEYQQPETSCAPKERDEAEIYLVREAIDRRLPLLGLCRGCQVLAVATGGTLYQHVPDLTTNEQHGLGEGASYSDLVSGNRHPVIIERESKTYHLLKKEQIITNSAHHQAVKSIGADMAIVGRSPAGIVEIIEHRAPEYFCFGLQSHPEALDKNADLAPFFNAFHSAIEKFKPQG